MTVDDYNGTIDSDVSHVKQGCEVCGFLQYCVGLNNC
jgi:hypothetical protein